MTALEKIVQALMRRDKIIQLPDKSLPEIPVGTLTIIRGLPGSGKSTLAKALISQFKDTRWFEADQFFVNTLGEYKFEVANLDRAHDWCKQHVKDAMSFKVENIIVSNTFVRLWEMQPYYNLASAYNYQVQEIACQGPFQNVHGVPEENMERMKRHFQFRPHLLGTSCGSKGVKKDAVTD